MGPSGLEEERTRMMGECYWVVDGICGRGVPHICLGEKRASMAMELKGPQWQQEWREKI